MAVKIPDCIDWLLDTAEAPIHHNLTRSAEDAISLLKNIEVSAWLTRLTERAKANEIGAIHGSHDYRMENILGKCWALGLHKEISAFADKMSFIVDYLNRHIQTPSTEELNFGKLYHFRDCEVVEREGLKS